MLQTASATQYGGYTDGASKGDTLSETLNRARAYLGQIEHTAAMIIARHNAGPLGGDNAQAGPPEPDHINWKANDIACRLNDLNDRLAGHLNSL